ncbi:MAG: DUF11 domain-containing protein [Clostridium sp.]|uniref:DUF11 domain-containing protein n=1 Tax=Clostridium sp. TaxID=1506 RepID=UPI003F2B5336
MAFINAFKGFGYYKIIQTGNTLGVDKGATTANHYISLDTTLNSAGTISTDPLTYGGTTLTQSLNGSWAELNPDTGTVPSDAEIVFAFLNWGGQNSSVPTTSIKFTDPTGTTTNIAPNPLYNQTGTDTFRICYTSGADVTNIVKAAGLGKYSVADVKGIMPTIGLGWILCVVFKHSSFDYSSVDFFSVANFNYPAASSTTINGVYTPTSGPLKSRVAISAIYGDAPSGDGLTLNGVRLAGPNNPSNNFYRGYICDYNGDIATVGSFADLNVGATPFYRYGYDITNVDGSPGLTNGTSSITVGLPFSAGDSMELQFLAISVLQNSAIIVSSKTIDKSFVQNSDTVVYTLTIQNTGSANAINVNVIDTLPTGFQFIPNTVMIDGVSSSGNIQTGIVLANSIPPNGVVTISFKANVGTDLIDRQDYVNTFKTQYSFTANPTTIAVVTNTVVSSAAITTASLPPIALKKYVDPTVTYLGGTITYTVEITNIAAYTVTGAKFYDTLPNGTTLVPNSIFIDNVAYGGNIIGGVLVGTIPGKTTVTVQFSVIT